MPNSPDRAELEAAIYRHLSLQPAHETTEALIVKVAELEPITWPPDSKQLRAGLFLSVPFLGADRTKLDQALARVRKGFKRNEILSGSHVEVSEEKVYSHQDDEAGAVLLTLPVVLTLTPPREEGSEDRDPRSLGQRSLVALCQLPK